MICAGSNGPVAANHLIDAGWSVLVSEEQDEVGGAVRSRTDVRPYIVYDTFSSSYPLAPSPAVHSRGLQRHGRPSGTRRPCPRPATAVGQWALLHRDRER